MKKKLLFAYDYMMTGGTSTALLSLLQALDKDKYEIDLIPLHVHLGDNHYLDGVDITPDQIYFWSNQTKQSPKTSALSPYEAQLYLINALRKAEDILCFTISEKMSSCCSVMYTTAAEMDALDRVHIIDSGNLSSGIALQILAAADMIKE